MGAITKTRVFKYLWKFHHQKLKVFRNSSNNSINKINKLQRRACKLILGNEYTSLEEARNRLKILSSDESVFLQKAETMYKIANKIAPKYLIDLFQIRNTYANSTTSNLRSVSNRNFIIPKPNINLFKNSISYSGTIIWNSIPLEIKNADSINSFVNRCVAWIKNWNYYFIDPTAITISIHWL